MCLCPWWPMLCWRSTQMPCHCIGRGRCGSAWAGHWSAGRWLTGWYRWRSSIFAPQEADPEWAVGSGRDPRRWNSDAGAQGGKLVWHLGIADVGLYTCKVRGYTQMSYFEYRKICGGDYTRAFFEGFYDVLVTDRSKGYNKVQDTI